MRYQGFELDPFQAQAIAALQAGDSVLVCAPTGTGKTVVADWLVETVLARGQEAVYTAPIKALSNQKFRDYGHLLGEERVGLVTGDLVIRREAPCRVMTTEILRNILLAGEAVPELAAVVIDEIHYLDDRERGTTWEEVLLYLPQHVQILGLSATLSNLQEFAAWLQHVRERPVVVVEEHRRAVPLDFVVANREVGLRAPDEMNRLQQRWARHHAGALKAMERAPRRFGRRTQAAPELERPTRHQDVFRMLVPDQLPYLYFVFSRRQAEAYARQLALRLGASLLEEDELAHFEEELRRFSADPGNAAALDPGLLDLYRMGVGFHHAGLHVNLKVLVERLYELRLLKVLYCTGTFAVGINMPARAAVFDGLERYDGRGMIRLSTREFMQMAGRAGRRGMDERGLVVVRADMMEWPNLSASLESYLRGRYEPVRSSFSLSFNSVVNLLHRNGREHIRSLVERSFLAFHRSSKDRALAGEVADLERALADDGWVEGQPTPDTLRKRVRQLRRLREEASAGDGRTWAEFEAKVRFLQDIGYIAEDGSFNAGAKVLMHIQIQEIFATELFLSGVLETLPMPVFFGVLCGMCNALPRAVQAAGGREHRGLARTIEHIRHSDAVVEAERLSHAEVVWDPQMIQFGRWWADGRSLNEILLNLSSPNDVSGDLVGAFRRARELASQIRAAMLAGLDPRADELGKLIRDVSRAEVEVVD